MSEWETELTGLASRNGHEICWVVTPYGVVDCCLEEWEIPSSKGEKNDVDRLCNPWKVRI